MLRTPIPNTKISQMEKFTPGQLLSIFESCKKAGSATAEHGLLYEAWATLFSKLYLTPEDLISGIESGEHRIGEDNEEMLCRFIKADCASRGIFTLNIIKKGSMLDRAALIMIADLEDVAAIEHEGTTGLHLLVTACDKRVRPALIREAGKKLLSGIYNNKGLPPLFLFFALSDLSISDLDAIEKLFPKEDLVRVMAQNRRGRNALEVFTEISPGVRQNTARERNAFEIPTAVKTTNLGKGGAGQGVSPVYREGFSIPPVKAMAGKNAEPDTVRVPTAPARNISPKPPSAGSKGKVMIVDDDEIIRNLLQLRLELLGYETCATADSGEDAVMISKKSKPDLVFMDIMMPGKLDGIHAAREIKAHSDSRIIFISGYSDQDILDRAKEIQPAGFIVKPFTDTSLRVALNFMK